MVNPLRRQAPATLACLGVPLRGREESTADVSWSDVRVGAAVEAVAWTALQALGGCVVGHQLQHASATYGTFAIVVGLLGWMYIGRSSRSTPRS